MELQFLVAVALASTYGVYARPDGAPLSVCESMTPAMAPHGPAQTVTSPYSITVPDGITMYTDGVQIQVTIGGDTFRGLLLQARRVSGSMDPVGTFDLPDAANGLKLSNCANIDGSAITHANRNDKNDSVVMWNPPSTDVGDIEFVATVVQIQSMWWPNNKSPVLTYDPTNPTMAPMSTESTNTGCQLQGSGGSLWFYLVEATLAAIYVIGL